jgi:hypothetical protein
MLAWGFCGEKRGKSRNVESTKQKSKGELFAAQGDGQDGGKAEDLTADDRIKTLDWENPPNGEDSSTGE